MSEYGDSSTRIKYGLWQQQSDQKYVVGQLFPPEFYAGLLWAWDYNASLAGEELKTRNLDEMSTLDLCSVIANSDPANPGYGLFDTNIDLTNPNFLSNLSEAQVHQLYQLLSRSIDPDELPESVHDAILSVHYTFMNPASTPAEIQLAVDQSRAAVAEDPELYAFILQSLKSTLYGIYGRMIPPLLAVAKGALEVPLDNLLRSMTV